MRLGHIRKHLSSPLNHNQQGVFSFVINGLEKTIDPKNYLPGRHQCACEMCTDKNPERRQRLDGNIFRSSTKESSYWLKKVLDALCLSGAKSLKLWLPDILFVQGESLETFQTSRRDGRVIKFSGTTPLKSMFLTMVRLRREYKTLLQQNFNQKMLEKIDPDQMHIKYFEKLVPSHFHDGMENQSLQNNKFQFKRYILHTNKKYEIQQIQEHKMNQKEPFCLVKYTDGNCQLFNQVQFQVYSLTAPIKLQEQMVFVQSYIKYKLETEAIYYSEYTLSSQTLNSEMDKRAERDVMILIGGLNQFDEDYTDLDSVDELSTELMFAKPKQYVELLTYKIVHYLNMTSRIYIDHIKIKWIMNDIGNVYLQEIMEFEMSQIPRRLIKFRLPPKDEALVYYHQSHNFVEMYKEMKKRKAVNTAIIKKDIQTKTYEEVLSIIDQQHQFSETKIEPREPSEGHLFIRSKRSTAKQFNKKTYKIHGRYSTIGQHQKQNNQTVFQDKNQRSQSFNIDKWDNLDWSSRKKNPSTKISPYFTISTPFEGNRTTRQSTETEKRDNRPHKQLLFSTNRLIGCNRTSKRKQTGSQNSSRTKNQQFCKRVRQKLSIKFS